MICKFGLSVVLLLGGNQNFQPQIYTDFFFFLAPTWPFGSILNYTARFNTQQALSMWSRFFSWWGRIPVGAYNVTACVLRSSYREYLCSYYLKVPMQVKGLYTLQNDTEITHSSPTTCSTIWSHESCCVPIGQPFRTTGLINVWMVFIPIQ